MVATAFHKGYYQFRLCENDIPQKGKDASIAVTQDCFEKNILKSPKNDTKYVVPGPRPKIGPSRHIEANLLSNIPNESSGPEDFRSAGNFYG